MKPRIKNKRTILIIISCTIIELIASKMESISDPTVDENGIPLVTKKDVVKEGYLFKQSRYLKDWRK